MKKLIFALAATVMGVVANAATANWSASGIYVPDSDPASLATGYKVYFIASADYARESAVADLGNKDISFLSHAMAKGDAVTDGGMATAQGWGSYGNKEDVTGYLVIFNDDVATDATLAFVSAEVTKATGTSGQAANLKFGLMDGTGTSLDTRVASNWYAIPEPTSGLLLLLGVAGLALRRRRA